MYKKLIAAAIAVAGVVTPLANINNVYAEDTLTTTTPTASSSWIQVSPVSSRVTLKPGTALDYSMIVSNIGTDEFKFNTYTAPYSIVDEDYNVSFSNENNRTQLARWIQFVNDDGSLTDKYSGSIPAGEKKTVNYRITVPEDVPAGGQYATIFAQTDPDGSGWGNSAEKCTETAFAGRSSDSDTGDRRHLYDHKVENHGECQSEYYL